MSFLIVHNRCCHLMFAYSARFRFQICIFYLVLRGLDTIEDDMTIPDEVKQPILRSFHKHTVTPGWRFTGCGPNEKDRQLLIEYDTVVGEVNLLAPQLVTPIYLHLILISLFFFLATGMSSSTSAKRCKQAWLTMHMQPTLEVAPSTS